MTEIDRKAVQEIKRFENKIRTNQKLDSKETRRKIYFGKNSVVMEFNC